MLQESAKKNVFLEQSEQQKQSYLSAANSQDEKENYKLSAKDMLLEFEKTYLEKGLHELISSS